MIFWDPKRYVSGVLRSQLGAIGVFPMRAFPLSLLLVSLGIPSLAEAQSTRPLRVALYDFDQTSVVENIKKELGQIQNYGKTASDLLLSRLISANAEVISRDQIERLLKEQNLKYSDRFDATQAAQYGKLLGVDVIITGTIDSLYIEQKRSNIVLRQKVFVHANVEVTAKMVSTATGKILAAPSYKGHFEKEMGSAWMSVTPGGNNRSTQPQHQQSQGAGGDTGTRQGNDPYIREALRDSIQHIGKDLVAEFPRLQPIDLSKRPTPSIRPRTDAESTVASNTNPPANGYLPVDDEIGVILKVSEDSVVISVNEGVTLKPDQILEVQKAEIVADPRTSRKIAIGEKAGTLKVTDVKSAYVRAALTSGKASQNDRVVMTKAAPAKKAAPAPVKKAAPANPSAKPIPPPPGR